MSDLTIRQLFERRLIAWADQQGLPVETENTRFTPPADGAYLRVTLLPAETVSDDLAGEHTGYAGLLQIDIFDRTGGGTAETGRIAGLLRALFPVNLLLTEDDFAVQVTRPLSVGTGFPTDGRFMTPCRLRYAAHTG